MALNFTGASASSLCYISSSSATATATVTATPHHQCLIPRLHNNNNNNTKLLFNNSYSSSKTFAARSEDTEIGVTDQDPPPFLGSFSSTGNRNQLDLLEQLTSTTTTSTTPSVYEKSIGSEYGSRKVTIREQLAQLVGERSDGETENDEFSIPLGKKLKKVSAKFLTVSQKRNIRRQAYLDQVSQRNDSLFFATIGAFVILPPLLILGISILTGYVQLFP